MDKIGGGNSTIMWRSTPQNNASRIRHDVYENEWYVLDSNSPQAVHKKFMTEFWNRESKDGTGSKRNLWEFCFGPESRNKLWEGLDVGELNEDKDNVRIRQVQGEGSIPPCPSSNEVSRECDSYDRIQERKKLILNNPWESQVIEWDGEEVEQSSIARYLLNKFFPIPEPKADIL